MQMRTILEPLRLTVLLSTGLIGLSACESLPSRQQPAPEPSPTIQRPGADISKPAPRSGTRQFAILAVNDVYRITGLLPAESGGLARLRTLRKELERQYPDLLFLHAGDALFPSLLSREFDGAQMIDVLNLMDGREDAVDDRMIAVLGNHEFDKKDSTHASLFRARMLESDFRWLYTNVTLENTREIEKEGGSREPSTTRVDMTGLENGKFPVLVKKALETSGGVRVGIFGLTRGVDVAYAKSRDTRAELESIARSMSAQLRAEGAEFVIALTHLSLAQDRWVCGLGQAGPDLIIGGHEHHHLDDRPQGCPIFKADADALSASFIEVTVPASGEPGIDYTLKKVGQGFQRPDPQVRARVESWLIKHERLYCRSLETGSTRYCLDERLARLDEDLIGEEISIRGEDTNLGRWVASLLLQAGQDFATRQSMPAPQIAFINSGSLRLNQNLGKGSLFLRRHFEELIAYDDEIYIVAMTRSDLKTALERSGVCRMDGAWLQVAGLSYTVDGRTGAVSNIKIGGTPLAAAGDTIYAVTTEFLLTDEKRDGYQFPADGRIRLKTVANKDLMLKAIVWDALDGVETFPPMPAAQVTVENGDAGTPQCPER